VEEGRVQCIGTLDVTDLRTDVGTIAASLSSITGIRSVSVEEGPLEGFAAARGFVLEARGYGTPIEVLSDPNGGRYRFEVGHLIECEVLSKYVTGRARTSNFFRGMIAGALSTIEGGEWEVEEVECINDGSDKCAFEARRKGK
jgi:hypothetical protein